MEKSYDVMLGVFSCIESAIVCALSDCVVVDILYGCLEFIRM